MDDVSCSKQRQAPRQPRGDLDAHFDVGGWNLKGAARQLLHHYQVSRAGRQARRQSGQIGLCADAVDECGVLEASEGMGLKTPTGRITETTRFTERRTDALLDAGAIDCAANCEQVLGFLLELSVGSLQNSARL